MNEEAEKQTSMDEWIDKIGPASMQFVREVASVWDFFDTEYLPINERFSGDNPDYQQLRAKERTVFIAELARIMGNYRAVVQRSIEELAGKEPR